MAMRAEEAGVDMTVERTFHDDVATFTDVLARFSDGTLRLSFMNEDANPLVAMHCLAAADALVVPAENGEKPSSFALMAATLSRGSVIPSIERT